MGSLLPVALCAATCGSLRPTHRATLAGCPSQWEGVQKQMLCVHLLYITYSAVCTCKHSCHSSAHHPQRQGQGCPGGLAASSSWPLRLLPAPQHWRQLSQPSSHRSCHLHLPAQQLLHHQCCGGRQCCHLPHPPASSSVRALHLRCRHVLQRGAREPGCVSTVARPPVRLNNQRR